MRMLWFTPTLFGPNSSDVIDTAAENTKPELNPTKLVLNCNAVLVPDMASKMNAIGVGIKAAANHPVLAICVLLHFSYNISGLTIIKISKLSLKLQIKTSKTYLRNKSGAAARSRPKKEHVE